MNAVKDLIGIKPHINVMLIVQILMMPIDRYLKINVSVEMVKFMTLKKQYALIKIPH